MKGVGSRSCHARIYMCLLLGFFPQGKGIHMLVSVYTTGIASATVAREPPKGSSHAGGVRHDRPGPRRFAQQRRDNCVLSSRQSPRCEVRVESSCQGSAGLRADAVGGIGQWPWRHGVVPCLPRLLLLSHGVHQRGPLQVIYANSLICRSVLTTISSGNPTAPYLI